MKHSLHQHIGQQGKVVVKVFWLTSIILSILLTLLLNLIFNLF